MMKIILSLLLSFSFLTSQAQLLEQAVDAFGKGDADKIGSMISKDVEISILNDVDFYTKDQAVARLKNFFAKYPPKTISVIHKGTSKNSDSKFVISQFNAGNERFRLYLYSEANGSNFRLAEIRIEKE